MNQPYGSYAGGQPPIADATADKQARYSMYLGASSLLFTCFSGVPAIVLGAIAMSKASPRAKQQALIGIGLGSVTSLGTVALIAVAAFMPPKPHAQPATAVAASVSTPSATGTAARPASAASARAEPEAAAAPVAVSPLDAWAARAVAASDFDIGFNDSWALYPAGSTDCGTNGDGKPMWLDRPTTSDQFEARRQEALRGDIVKKFAGRLVKLDYRNVEVEFGDYDFKAQRLPIKVRANGPWPLGAQAPTFRRESDSFEAKRKIGELGGKDLTVTGEQTLIRFENASTLAFTVQVPADQAERWIKGDRKLDILIVERFLGLGFHKVCQTSCARILGVNECSPDNVGFGPYNRADLVGYRVSVDGVVVGEKQPSGPPPAE